MKRLVTAFGVAACIALTMTGCRADDGAAASTTVTSGPGTTTSGAAESSTGTATASDSDARTPATAGHGKCLDPASPVVLAEVGKIDSYYGRDFYTYRASSENLGSCPKLMWVEAHLRRGTASSPKRVLFFDADGFLRTDTPRNSALSWVTGSTDDSVSVKYFWLNPGDITARPTGGPVTVTFTLNGKTITTDRDVPPQAYGAGGTTTATTPTTAPISTEPTSTPNPVSHCDSATATTLHDAADMQYHSRLVQPFTMVNILCKDDWAIARTESSADQPVRVLFRYTGGGWSTVTAGSGFQCTENGVPATTAAALDCD